MSLFRVIPDLVTLDGGLIVDWLNDKTLFLTRAGQVVKGDPTVFAFEYTYPSHDLWFYPNQNIAKFLVHSALPLLMNSDGVVFIALRGSVKKIAGYFCSLDIGNLGDSRLCVNLSVIHSIYPSVCDIDTSTAKYSKAFGNVSRQLGSGYFATRTPKQIEDQLSKLTESFAECQANVSVKDAADNQQYSGYNAVTSGSYKFLLPTSDPIEVANKIAWWKDDTMLMHTNGTVVKVPRVCTISDVTILNHRGYCYPDPRIMRFMSLTTLPIAINKEGLVYFRDGHKVFFLGVLDLAELDFGSVKFNFSFLREDIFASRVDEKIVPVTAGPTPPPTISPPNPVVTPTSGGSQVEQDLRQKVLELEKDIEDLKLKHKGEIDDLKKNSSSTGSSLSSDVVALKAELAKSKQKAEEWWQRYNKHDDALRHILRRSGYASHAAVRDIAQNALGFTVDFSQRP